jgi:serine/threonine-protein kinase
VTGRSDVYSLGIVLYEMLTGRRPFEGDSAAGVALKRLNEDPPPPQAFRPVPSGLAAIVMRALQRDPERRFPDAGSFAEALRVWQRDPAAGAAAASAAAGVAAGGAAPVTPPPEAPIPRSGEPTVYVPPPVARPSDRAPSAMNVNAPPPRGPVPPRPAERQGQPWWMWLLVLLAIILLGAIGFLGAQILGGLTPGNGTPSPSADTFEMPDWTDRPLAEVRTLADQAGLEIGVIDREPSDEIDDGRVISTDPAGGEEVAEGDIVDLVVSTGAEEVAVPRLIGQTEQQAIETLREADLRLGQVTREPSSEPAGTVLRSSPAEGVTVSPGDQVDLVISLGPTPSPSPSPTLEPTLPPTPPPTEQPTQPPSEEPSPTP